MSDWLEEGATAPKFSLKGDDGKTYKLAEMTGKPVVVYFYPKDDTPGCTIEACAFRDRKAEIEKLGAVVLGVSPDDAESHAKFRKKFDLNFPLLVDTDHKLADQFGAWREKNMYGKKSMGVVRSTFLIGPDGKIAKAWKKVSVEGHDEQVIKAIRALKS
jgi:peroxiredoxin Q/BCP